MTSDYQYTKAVELALGMAKITTRERVKVLTWPPFQILYVEMAKRKEILRITELPEAEKRSYWNEATEAQRDRPNYKKMYVVQALHMWDLITTL